MFFKQTISAIGFLLKSFPHRHGDLRLADGIRPCEMHKMLRLVVFSPRFLSAGTDHRVGGREDDPRQELASNFLDKPLAIAGAIIRNSVLIDARDSIILSPGPQEPARSPVNS